MKANLNIVKTFGNIVYLNVSKLKATATVLLNF